MSNESPVGPDLPRLRGPATPDTIITGCIVLVEKDGHFRRAEILSIRDTKSGRQLYCNFDNYNKRLDEWVPVSRIDFGSDVEWPNPEKDKAVREKKTAAASAARKKQCAARKREHSVVSAKAEAEEDGDEAVASLVAGDTPDGEQMELDEDETTPAGQAKKERKLSFSREDEIEKLRTSGSMTQNPAEISRIRNISRVEFGQHVLFPWYFSPYPEVFGQEDCIFICEFCLCYSGSLLSFARHRAKCTLQHPPGNEIYRDDYVSFFEIDGRRQRTWCRNLCLLSKMFLDHKTLYYDVDPFLFYVMTTRDEKGCHLIGYFSKEKESADGYNVACILTLPQYQRKGYGRLLIQFSYELSKIEGKLGSPEKPLSDLGLLSYRQYWAENMIELLIGYHEREDKITIEAIAAALSMTTADVEHTLQALKMQVYHKGEHKIVVPEKLLGQREGAKNKLKRVIDPTRIRWKPPVFTASSRTWGW